MTKSNSLTVWGGNKLPKPTPEMSKQLSPQDLQDHRQKLISEVRVVLSAYFQPSESQDIITAQLAWWADELHDWEIKQVVWGLRQWNRDNPSKRPTPGHILKLLKEARGRKEAKRMRLSKPATDPQSAEITEEERAKRKAFVDEVMSGYRERE